MNLKAILSFILAGFLGGLICIGAISITNNESFLFNGLTNVSTISSTPVTGPDFAAAAEIAQKAVVLIEASESEQAAQDRYRRNPLEDILGGLDMGQFGFELGPRIRKGAGSGVIISKNGYILTNNHVIDFAESGKVNVKTSDGKEYK